MKYVFVVLMLLGALQCGASEVVVLTETPVPEFSLPDGSVLTNAYAWRRDSRGIMIMHDGGSYFLNFALLPDDWKAVYLDPPVENQGVVEKPVDPKPEKVPVRDRYKATAVLEEIPDLDPAARVLLLSADGSGELDQKILMLGVLHNLLEGNRDEARRFALIIEEKEYELEEVDIKRLFQKCSNCGGDGHMDKTCKTCEGSGLCDRCEGEGASKSSFDDSQLDCTACRGNGKCPRCKGAGEFRPPCPKCKAAGKLVDLPYCEILRDHMVRTINAEATPDRWSVLTSSASSHMDKVLPKISGLKESAQAFYLSEAYAGGMDADLVVACLMHSLLKEDFKEAERFHKMLEVLFPKADVLEIDKYLKPCANCASTGRIEKDCRNCSGSGGCNRCNGTGQRTLEIDASKIHCTTCRGTGECTSCRGLRVFRLKCKTCDGRGNVRALQRIEIKLGLVVDRLNEFYDAR